MKLLVIGLVVAIALLGGWRFMAGRVDQTNPNEVATAYIQRLKSENITKAAALWLPETADAWSAGATKTMGSWQSGMYNRFFEGLPANPVFTKSQKPKSPANEQTMTADGAALDLRQVDGKWWVIKGPL